MIRQLRIFFLSIKVRKVPPDYHTVLSAYSDYYNNLNPALQKVFRKRVYISCQFIAFYPLQLKKVTREMGILITSALVQITFGLNKYVLDRFKTIYVAPNTYSYGQYPALLGHVDFNSNLIVMSWPSVKQGFIIPDDAMNVALHELSHALQAEDTRWGLSEKFFDAIKMRNFEIQGLQEIYLIRTQRHTFLRNYAGQNMKELFAVCMECFFEQPLEFKAKVPKLYRLMVELLKQDPSKSNPLVY